MCIYTLVRRYRLYKPVNVYIFCTGQDVQTSPPPPADSQPSDVDMADIQLISDDYSKYRVEAISFIRKKL